MPHLPGNVALILGLVEPTLWSMTLGIRRSRTRLGLVAVAGFLAAGCGQPADPLAFTDEATVVRLAGSGTAAPIVELLAEQYESTHPGVRFQFDVGTGSGGGVQGVADGTLDLGLVNRPLDDDEAALGLAYHPFAHDAMIFAVNEPNKITELATSEIRSLYAGVINDWRALGGDPLAVILLGRDADESATKLFFEPLADGIELSPNTAVLTRSSEMVDALATTPGAIGYTTLGSLRVGSVDRVQPIGLDGVMPSSASLVDGTYPWMMTLAVVSRLEGASTAVDDFILFLHSPEAQNTLSSFDYAPAN